MILSGHDLDVQDMKNMRLVGWHKMEDLARSFVFEEVPISRLTKHQDHFLEIAKHDHLRNRVIRVVWLEFWWYPFPPFDAFNHEKRVESRIPHGNVLERLWSDWCKSSMTDIWFPSLGHVRAAGSGFTDFQSYESSIDAWRERQIMSFRPEFFKAIDRFISLRTFVSKPMSPLQIISNIDKLYPFEAHTSQMHIVSRQYNNEVLSRDIQSNDGLFLFLLPSMRRPRSRVRHLVWADECPGLSYLRPLPSNAFHMLETIDLYFTSPVHAGRYNTPQMFDGLLGGNTLVEELQLASGHLRQFRLCIDNNTPDGEVNWLERLLLCAFSTEDASLTEMELIRYGVENDVRGSFHSDMVGLSALVRSNSATLRRLYIEGAPISGQLIKSMASNLYLQLESLDIVSRRSGVHYHDRQELLDWINGVGDFGYDDGGGVLTNESWVSTSKRGLLVEEFGTSLLGIDDTDTMDSHSEVSTDGSFSDGPKWHSTCKEIVTPGDSDGEETASVTTEDSLDIRIRTAPLWACGLYWVPGVFYKEGWEMYYYSVGGPEDGDDNSVVYQGSIWKFTNNQGEVGWGRDPLEWWDKWDVNQGDQEESEPFGPGLAKILLLWEKGGYDKWERFADHMLDPTIRPPAHATRLMDSDVLFVKSTNWQLHHFDLYAGSDHSSAGSCNEAE